MSPEDCHGPPGISPHPVGVPCAFYFLLDTSGITQHTPHTYPQEPQETTGSVRVTSEVIAFLPWRHEEIP